MNTLDHFANASFDASLFAEVSNILASFADDDTGFFGRNNGAEGQLRLRVLFFSLGLFVSSITHVELVHAIGKAGVVNVVGIDGRFSGCHCE